MAPSLRVEVNPVNVRDAGEIERAVAAFARAPNGGLIVTASALAAVHRDLIVTLAARHKLPAVYFDRSFVAAGGLISYGPRSSTSTGRAAGYVDRILKGEKPADLPVQAPTKYELVINLKTAKALGLDRAAVAARPRRRGDRMRRREVHRAVRRCGGGAACRPLAARAQQPAMPVIGFLNPAAAVGSGDRVRGFRQGLKESGFVETENVVVDYRWADNQVDRLPTLAAELVKRRVAVIATVAPPSTLAAKAATTMIPIVFLVAEDPVGLGLVASLARPGGNLTGINILSAELVSKRLQLLREILPAARRVAVFVNPANTAITERTLQAVEPAARAMGLQLQASQRQHEPRDQHGVCSFCGRTT